MPDLLYGRDKMYRFPTMEADEDYIIGFRDRYFQRHSQYRNRHLTRIALALYYDLGRQWIERDWEQTFEGVRGFAFREMQPTTEIELPRPVTNRIAPAIDIEFATLSKRQWKPKVVTGTRDPRMQAAVKVANDVLNDRLKKLDWPDKRDKFIRNVITFGTGIIKSHWNDNWSELMWVSVDALGCTQCGALYSEPNTKEGVPISACVACGGPLVSAELDEEQSMGQDIFARPLGQNVPKGGTDIDVISPFEYFPENAGVNIEHAALNMHGIGKVRSLDYVEEHWPHLIDKVEPEHAEELMRNHPFLGEWDIIGRFDYGFDAGIYDHHVQVFEMYHNPSFRHPEGRNIVVIGSRQNLIAENTTLMQNLQDEKGEAAVPKVLFTTAVWKEREGEFWGKALADDLISPQNRINGMDAQTIEARERMGSPNLIIPDDADLEGPEFNSAYGLGKLFRYRVSPINPNAKPEVFGSILMPSGVYQERQSCVDDMTAIVGPADIEIGEAPRNVTTTSGLQILGEQAERKRATRERGIVTSLESVWEHQLKLLWVNRVDPDTYEAASPDGSWEVKQYNREAIAGQTKVQVEKQAYVDHSVIQREATREALTDQLYDISSPLARKRILENMGLPTDINEDSNLQIDKAKQQWVDFVDDGTIPVIDASIDNPNIRFQTLGTQLLQDEGKQMADEASWGSILPLIAGWEDELARMEAQDQQTREFYGGEPEPNVANEMFAKATAQYEEQMARYETMVTVAMEASGPQGGQPDAAANIPPPPQEPPPPIFLPKQMEIKVFGVWQQMIEKHTIGQPVAGLQGIAMQKASETMEDPAAAQQRIVQFLRFRAVVDAYRLLSQKAAMEAAAQATTPPPASGPGPAPGQTE
ncbi:MAG: hypothetical protein GY906_24940 [bacterium]|nr:hypothetical protein [bacterium]